MKLIIVESPKKAKTISTYLSGEYKVLASKGHVIDLPKNSLGVDVENMFIPFFSVMREKEKELKLIKDAAKNSDSVYLATDPDREGEAIAYHIEREIKKDEPNKETKRLILHEITKTKVLESLNNPVSIDMNRVESQITRRIIDRLIGFYLSPFLWKMLKNNRLSAGRVQSTVLNFIVEREKEIIDFESKKFYQITCMFVDGDNVYNFNLIKLNNKKPPFENKEELEEYKKSLNRYFELVEIKKENKKVYPMPPFTTSALQKDAFNRLKFPSSKTMKIAQQLYEGVKIDNKLTGLITYMRTDSVRVSDVAVNYLRSYLKENYPDYISDAKRFFNNFNKVQDAHEAIRPVDIRLTPERVKQFLDKDSFLLYELIYKRFIATQMKPSFWENTKVVLKNGEGIWETSFYKVIDIGFEKFYPVSRFELKDDFKIRDLIPKKIEIKEKKTSPPPRYTEASIIEKMEKEGIGRPSTYAPTISLLLKRKYIERVKNSLKPTKLGFMVDAVLSNYFKELISKEFTSNMETYLDNIETNDLSRLKVLTDFYSVLSNSLKTAGSFNYEILKSKYVDSLKTENIYLDKPCPRCGGRLIKRSGRYGSFFGCEKYPSCDYTVSIPKKRNKKNS